jgi:hypothetical protein
MKRNKPVFFLSGKAEKAWPQQKKIHALKKYCVLLE